MPYRLRVAAASTVGYRLRWERYGPKTEALVQEYAERASWPSSRWRRWEEEQLARLLHRAATRVPYYRQVWEARRAKGDRSSIELLSNWPILEKEQIRLRGTDMVADDVNPNRLIHEVTSGTTGKAIDLWYSVETTQAWYALFESRVRIDLGVSRDDRWALIAGKLVAPVAAAKPPYWVWNRGLNQLYLSSVHASSDNAEHYLGAIRSHGVRYIIGYPSSLCALAKGIERDNLGVPKLQGIITQSEQLYRSQRELLERVFQCPVRDTYGMSEMCAAASECKAGTLHIWPEAGMVEILENGEAAPAGTPGDLVCTGLLNPDMPLIRYRVGDRGWLAQPGPDCACGSKLPALGGLLGRIADTFVSPGGHVISPSVIEAVFDRKIPLIEGQLIQEAIDRVTVLYVPDRGFGPEHCRAIERDIVGLMGSVEVAFTQVDRIPRGPNGKLRVVVSRVNRDRSRESIDPSLETVGA